MVFTYYCYQFKGRKHILQINMVIMLLENYSYSSKLIRLLGIGDHGNAIAKVKALRDCVLTAPDGFQVL